MTRLIGVALAALVLLAGCGAGDPPRAAGGIDLSGFWRGSP
jgi:hypothetical protein